MVQSHKLSGRLRKLICFLCHCIWFGPEIAFLFSSLCDGLVDLWIVIGVLIEGCFVFESARVGVWCLGPVGRQIHLSHSFVKMNVKRPRWNSLVSIICHDTHLECPLLKMNAWHSKENERAIHWFLGNCKQVGKSQVGCRHLHFFPTF